MYIIRYVEEVLFLKKVFGITLILFGIIILVTSSYLFGLIFIVIGINLNLTEGSEIDLENKIYRNIKGVFGFTFGKWKPCPKFEYVSVFKTKENQKVSVVTASATFTNEIILLNLFYNGNKNITFYKTNDKKEAFKIAEHFRLALEIDILDATENEKKWL